MKTITLILKLLAEAVKDISKVSRFIAIHIAFPTISFLTKLLIQYSLASWKGITNFAKQLWNLSNVQHFKNKFVSKINISSRAKTYSVSALGLGSGICLALLTYESPLSEQNKKSYNLTKAQNPVEMITDHKIASNKNTPLSAKDFTEINKRTRVRTNSKKGITDNAEISHTLTNKPAAEVDLNQQATYLIAGCLAHTKSIRATYKIYEVLSDKYKKSRPEPTVARARTTRNNDALLGLTYGSQTSHSRTQYNGSYQREIQRARFEAERASNREMQRYSSHLNSKLRARRGY